jgi:hypothetical protein
MVRHTHRRRQSRGRRRNTRRSRRTQRGGFSFSSFFGSSDDVTDLKKKLAEATDPVEKDNIRKKIELAKLEIKYNEDKKMIENGTGTAAAAEGAASSVSSNSAVSSQSPYNSSASTGAGQMPSNGTSNMYSGIGGRRRSRRYRRK